MWFEFQFAIFEFGACSSTKNRKYFFGARPNLTRVRKSALRLSFSLCKQNWRRKNSQGSSSTHQLQLEKLPKLLPRLPWAWLCVYHDKLDWWRQLAMFFFSTFTLCFKRTCNIDSVINFRVCDNALYRARALRKTLLEGETTQNVKFYLKDLFIYCVCRHVPNGVASG